MLPIHMSQATSATKRAPLALPRWVAYLPLALLPALVLSSRAALSPWLLMVATFFGMYGGFKWLTFWEALRRGARPSLARAAGYLFLFAGTDASSFLDAERSVAKPEKTEWIRAATKMSAGLALMFAAARRLSPISPYLGVWLGMIGGVLIGHFGSFHLLSLAWRRAGVNAQFVMQSPMTSPSLSELWGKRWNIPFRDLVHRMVFVPLSPHVGPTSAMFAVFFVSGILHEMVVSFPAGAGWGLPTLYFLLQGGGVLVERSRTGRRWGLRGGWRGWLFAFAVAALPAPLLFHPPFIFKVGEPLLRWLGAL